MIVTIPDKDPALMTFSLKDFVNRLTNIVKMAAYVMTPFRISLIASVSKVTEAKDVKTRFLVRYRFSVKKDFCLLSCLWEG